MRLGTCNRKATEALKHGMQRTTTEGSAEANHKSASPASGIRPLLRLRDGIERREREQQQGWGLFLLVFCGGLVLWLIVSSL